MKHFMTPRTGAANLRAFFRAQAIDRMRHHADRTASLQCGLQREKARRDYLGGADANASFRILRAR
jgi:hypothetical protein